MPSPRVLAFDAGGTKLLGGVVSADGRAERRVRRVIAGLTRDELLDAFAEVAAELRSEASADLQPEATDVVAAGFGIPSLVDRRRGLSASSVHLPLDDLPFPAEMEERLGLPVAWDNDAHMALLAEHRLGAARGASDAVLLTVGTGIGGALLLGGRLYRGSTGAAGELGHFPVDLDGPPCQGDCPGRGCLEALASGSAIAREGAAAAAEAPDSVLGRAARDRSAVSGEMVTAAAIAGDEVARSVLARVGERLGVGLAGIVNAFDPEVVVVGGGAVRAGELLLGPARAVVRERALPSVGERVRIVAAELAEEAGMVGAGLAALEVAAGGKEADTWR